MNIRIFANDDFKPFFDKFLLIIINMSCNIWQSLNLVFTTLDVQTKKGELLLYIILFNYTNKNMCDQSVFLFH